MSENISVIDIANLNWDDLKFVLAVAEAGSVNSAARRLGVNHATVLRRIAQLEASLGHHFFDRDAAGYRPSRQGEKAVASAIRIRKELQSLNQVLNGLSTELDGKIRVTTTDSLLTSVVGAALRSFHERFPQIQIELVITNQLLRLNERAADVAIRPTREAPEGMHAQRICKLGFAIYASKKFMASAPDSPTPNTRWLALNPGQNKSPSEYWMQTHYPNALITITADSFASLGKLAEQDQGLAVLPCCLGETSDTLVRVGDPLADIETALWVMTPTELAGTARVQAFCEHMAEALSLEQAVISGTRSA
ncbi:MAG: LysR family transcriptional regulator [Burkholderiaceae bacterium]